MSVMTLNPQIHTSLLRGFTPFASLQRHEQNTDDTRPISSHLGQQLIKSQDNVCIVISINHEKFQRILTYKGPAELKTNRFFCGHKITI